MGGATCNPCWLADCSERNSAAARTTTLALELQAAVTKRQAHPGMVRAGRVASTISLALMYCQFGLGSIGGPRVAFGLRADV